MSRTVTAAVVFEQGGPFTLTEVVLDDPRPDEVVVRMVAAGMCHTDLSVQSGFLPFPMPAVLGHEGAGVVEEVGRGVTAVEPGDHVLISFTSCGECRPCTESHPAYCESILPLNLFGGARADGTATMTLDGKPLGSHFFGQSSFSTEALVDERSLVRVSPDAPLDLLAPLGCGIQTGAGTVLNVLCPPPGSSIAVFGTGSVGLAAVMAAALSGATRIVAVDLVQSRLDLARELGATEAVDAGAVNVGEVLAELTGGHGVDYAVDTTGIVEVLTTAVSSLAHRGTCALIAPADGPLPVNVHELMSGRRLVGITEGDSNPPVFVPALAELVLQGRLPLDRLVQHFDFADIENAAQASHRGDVVKPVLRFAAA